MMTPSPSAAVVSQTFRVTISMLPTMYHCGILVATLLSVALGEDVGSPSSALSVLPTQNPDTPLSMSDFCFFGKFPSASCRFKCGRLSKDSYCDAEKKMCLCTGPVEEDEDSGEVFNPPISQATTPGQETAAVPAPTQDTHFTVPMHPISATTETDQDQTGENKHHMVFYIFDLNKIFGKKKLPEEEASTTTEAGTQTETPEPPADSVATAGWSFQHLLAILIIVLLAILIFLELYAFFKKRNTPNHVENIFKTMPIPDKS